MNVLRNQKRRREKKLQKKKGGDPERMFKDTTDNSRNWKLKTHQKWLLPHSLSKNRGDEEGREGWRGHGW